MPRPRLQLAAMPLGSRDLVGRDGGQALILTTERGVEAAAAALHGPNPALAAADRVVV